MTGPWFSGVRGKVGKIAGARRRTSRWDDWRADALAYLPLAWRAPPCDLRTGLRCLVYAVAPPSVG